MPAMAALVVATAALQHPRGPSSQQGNKPPLVGTRFTRAQVLAGGAAATSALLASPRAAEAAFGSARAGVTSPPQVKTGLDVETLQELLKNHLHEEARERHAELLAQLCPPPGPVPRFAPPCSLLWACVDYRRGARPICDLMLVTPSLGGDGEPSTPTRQKA